MSDELIASLGPLPRQHGVLGAMLESREPYATTHPRASTLPRLVAEGHLDMRSFLGVLIAAPDGDRRLLPDREARRPRLHARGRAADHTPGGTRRRRDRERAAARRDPRARIVAERKSGSRLDLHDAVSQKLGLVLEAEAVATLLERELVAAWERRAAADARPRGVGAELGSLVFEPRPPDLARDGLGGALRKHVEVLVARLGHEQVELVAGERAGAERGRGTPTCSGSRRRPRMRSGTRAPAGSSSASVELDGRLELEVADDGVGFRPDSRGRALAQARLDLTVSAPGESAARSRSARRLASGRPCGSRRTVAELIRVLVVDDHAVVRAGLRGLLELQDGIEVGDAENGAEGIEAAARVRPDVVLMDLVMSGLDGVSAMRLWKRAAPRDS